MTLDTDSYSEPCLVVEGDPYDPLRLIPVREEMKIEEIQALIDAASPGPWRYDEPFVQQDAGVDGYRDLFRSKGDRPDEDAAFVVAARTLMPKLLEVAKASRAFFDDIVASDVLRYADRKSEDDLFTALQELES